MRRRGAGAGQLRADGDWQFIDLVFGPLARLGILVVCLLVAGSLGFVITEGTSVWGGFTWTLDTIATVGSVPAPASTGGQVLKALLIVLGVGTLYYALVSATEFFVAGHVTGLLDTHRRQRMVDEMSEHYLVCGFGRVGRQVARDLQAAGVSFVVIDRNPESLQRAISAGVPWLQGDATDEELLLKAGIERARGADRLRRLRRRERLHHADRARAPARPDRGRPRERLRGRAEASPGGRRADRVPLQVERLGDGPPCASSPGRGGRRRDAEYRMEEIDVSSGAPGAGRPLAEVAGPAIVAALRRAGGELVPQPPRDIVVEPGDVLIVMGTDETIDRLEALFTPERRS